MPDRPNDWNHLATKTAPPEVIELLHSKAWENCIDELAIAAYNLQLELNEKHKTASKDEDGANGVLESDVSGIRSFVPSLFNIVASKISDLLASDTSNAAVLEEVGLDDPVIKRALGQRDDIPYAVLCALKSRQADQPRQAKKRKLDLLPQDDREDLEDLGEWIIRNENMLRDQMNGVGRRWVRSAGAMHDWTYGLVRLSRHMDAALTNSVLTENLREIIRHPVSGFTILDAKRTDHIFVQPSLSKFIETFDLMTADILKGLDWSHVFVAGGIILGTLLCVGKDEEETSGLREQWKDSDVDIYIYDLDPEAANTKILHIFSVFSSNLPHGASTMVVRNSRTITFLSQYPTRRLQIVLKKVRHPKEVLLNFDLDICAMGYDGTEVWMLPRAVRALETGYNTFTMSMINGHYLGDRRATQETRVFKYAERGYGICFLPAYVSHVGLPALEKRCQSGRRFLRRLRARLDLSSNLSHADLEHIKDQRSPELAGTSCLSGFGLLMRHVALWEGEKRGDYTIKPDQWTSSTYPDGFGGYDDSPKYQWDKCFNFKTFETAIDKFNNRRIANTMVLQLTAYRDMNQKDVESALRNSSLSIARMRYAGTLQDLLGPGGDLILPIVIPRQFLDFAKCVLDQAFEASGIQLKSDQILIELATLPVNASSSSNDLLVFWRITTMTMWQQIDRRIDEIHELLWALHRAGCVEDNDNIRLRLFQNQITRRSFRKPRPDELNAFMGWVQEAPRIRLYDILATVQGYRLAWCKHEDDETSDEGAAGDG